MVRKILLLLLMMPIIVNAIIVDINKPTLVNASYSNYTNYSNYSNSSAFWDNLDSPANIQTSQLNNDAGYTTNASALAYVNASGNIINWNASGYIRNQSQDLSGYAQYQFGSNNFNGSGNYTTTGRIGIGTTTPNQLLQVNGTTNSTNITANNIAIGTPISAYALDIDSSAPMRLCRTGVGCMLLSYPSPPTTSLWTSSVSMMFSVNNNNAANAALTINTSGNVGINNTNPTTTLDVGGSIKTSAALTATNNIYTSSGLFGVGGGSVTYFGAVSSTNDSIAGSFYATDANGVNLKQGSFGSLKIGRNSSNLSIPSAMIYRNGSAMFNDTVRVRDITYLNGSAIGGGGTTDHSVLSNLNWASAGHTFNTDLDLNTYNITNAGSGTFGDALIFSDTTNHNLQVGYGTSIGGGSGQIAIGWNANALSTGGSSNIAIGQNSVCSGGGAIAAGYACSATGGNSVSVGDWCIASGEFSMAMGSSATASANYASTIGEFNTGYDNNIANSMVLGGYSGSTDEAWLRLGTGGIYDSQATPYLSISPSSRTLNDEYGSSVLSWASGGYYEVAIGNLHFTGSSSNAYISAYTNGGVDLNGETLVSHDGGGTISLDWYNRQLIANDGYTVNCAWATPYLLDCGYSDVLAGRLNLSSSISIDDNGNDMILNSSGIKLSGLTTNGFLKTSNGDGTLIVDTDAYTTDALAWDYAISQGVGTDNNTIARIGTCSEGYAVQNTTMQGVECILINSGTFDNSSIINYIDANNSAQLQLINSINNQSNNSILQIANASGNIKNWSTIITLENVAFINQTQTFTENQNFSKNVTIQKSLIFNASANACIFFNGTAIIINNNATGVSCQ